MCHALDAPCSKFPRCRWHAGEEQNRLFRLKDRMMQQLASCALVQLDSLLRYKTGHGTLCALERS
jgi:hypothetical protein